MRHKTSLPPGHATRWRLPPEIQPWLWTLCLLLSFSLQCTAEGGQLQTSHKDLEDKQSLPSSRHFLRRFSRASVDVPIRPDALKPLDDYINAKRKLRTGDGFHQMNYEGEVFQISHLEDSDEFQAKDPDNFQKRGSNVFHGRSNEEVLVKGQDVEGGGGGRGGGGVSVGEKLNGFPEERDRTHDAEKTPLVPMGDEPWKKDQGSGHESSITGTAGRTLSHQRSPPPPPLSPSETSQGGTTRTADRHERQRLRQRKNGRKRSRVSKSLPPVNEKFKIPMDKRKSINFQDPEGLSGKGAFGISGFHAENNPSAGLSSNDPLQTPIVEDIDVENKKGKQVNAYRTTDPHKNLEIIQPPSENPTSKIQEMGSRILKASPPTSRYEHVDEADPLGEETADMTGIQGDRNTSRQGEDRARRHLDGKDEETPHGNEGHVQKDSETTGVTASGNASEHIGEGDDNGEQRQKMSIRQEDVAWETLEDHLGTAEESEIPFSPEEAMYDISSTYYFGGGGGLGEPGGGGGFNTFMGDILQPDEGGSGCGCWLTAAQHEETECKCEGPSLKQVSANLSSQVNRITIMDAGLDTLRNDSFTRYRTTLKDIVLQNVVEFETIEPGTFSGLRQLRSIYIHSAPKLKLIRNLTFTEDNAKLRSLRIVSSGLEEVPNMEFQDSKEIFHMIELDSNRIQMIHSRSLQVRVEELSLNYNHIQSVEREAFSGSDIGKLSLKGNKELTYLDPDAFEGIGSLRTLDLSETSIRALPTSGLKDLEVLLLENTPTLKVFPSVYSFKFIKKASLTYPYHCCAFQFPEQHDREQYITHQKLKEIEQGHCSEVTSPSSPVLSPPTTRVRRRRWEGSTPNPGETPPPPSLSVSSGTPPPSLPGGGVVGSASSAKIPGGRVTEIEMNRRQTLPFSAAEAEDEKEKEEENEEVGEDDVEDDKAEADELWGNVRAEGGVDDEENAVVLSSPRKRHGNERLNVANFESGTDGKLLERGSSSSSRQLFFQRNKRSVKSVLMTDGLGHSKTRHFVSRGRRSRPRSAMNSSVVEHRPGKKKSKRYLGALRTPLSSAHEERQGRNSRNLLPITDDFIPMPNKRFETEIEIPGVPKGGQSPFEPLPEKRFGKEEEEGPLHPGGSWDDGSPLGPGAPGVAGGYPNYVAGTFGSFNHSSDKYPSSDVSGRMNDTTYVGLWGDPPPNIPGGFEDPSQPFGFNVNGGFIEEAQPPDTSQDIGDKSHAEWHNPGKPMNNTTIIVCYGKVSKNYHDVECVPAPDAFNPCEDIMGNLALRVAVWFVVVTAVVGNLAVMLVLVSSKFRMTVSKFLMVNLALADLSMGIYLLIIASMDLHTIGVYFNHAIDWQNGPGCKVAGFLTVFASELSIFTLTVITSERWYAITYAIHLNKRLKLSMAAKIMVVGWIYSITMATLPLVGISGYSKTSICLPMETGDALALAYLISLLLVNGLAFFVITACYASMYCSISRHDASASHSDLTVAKRMALLVFTDFACWAPIAFFGLTAVAGIPLINVTRAKILLVFFYPLNSCANPYLYAILTKQYRRDLFILLARYGFCTKRAMRYKGAYSSVNNTFPHNTVVNAPNHRNSTLTQITLCDLTRAARTSQQSNNGSLLSTMIGGSQDSLQRSISPSRTPTKPETCGGDTERLSTVQEISHSNHSDDDNNADPPCITQVDQGQQSSVVKQSGSPHPIKNCYTRLPFTPEQEELLKHALNESKARKRAKQDSPTIIIENGDQEKISELENGEMGACLQSPCKGETVVMCEVEFNNLCDSQDTNQKSSSFEETEATSTV